MGAHLARRWTLALALGALGCGSDPTQSTQPLAPAGNAAQQGPVNGISCEASEQFVLHIHAHLAVYDHGEARSLPAGIGITPRVCVAWLHTHDGSGILHIESPSERTFTLGDFFGVWGQPLDGDTVGPAQGAVTAFVDGVKVDGDPSSIALHDHAVVQLDVGEPVVAAQPYSFPSGL